MAVQINQFPLVVQAGQQAIAELMNEQLRALITVVPNGGASAQIEFTGDSLPDVEGGLATWQPWTNGVVSAQTVDIFDAPVSYVRVTATGTGSVLVKVRK